MDTGENKLDREMMKKLYEAYKLNTKKKIDEFNEAARKIISDKEYPEAEDILKLIPDNVRDKAEHDSVLYGDSFIAPVRSDLYDIWIDGISGPKIDTFTGCTQNFKPQQEYDKLEAVFNMLDADKPDKNGRIWKREFMNKILNNRVFLTAPRGHKSWMWLKLLEMELQKSYEANLVQTLETPPSTKVDLKSVIHMRWPKPDLSDLKPKVGKIDDLILIDYINNTFGPIDQMTIHSFMRYWPELVKKSPGPNLNDNKKALERVIKKGRKRK